MRIALYGEFLGWPHGAYFCNPPYIIAPQIKQHQVLCQFFFISQKVGFQGPVFFGGCAPSTGSGNRPDRYFLTEYPHENFGAGTHHLKAPEIKIEHKR